MLSLDCQNCRLPRFIEGSSQVAVYRTQPRRNKEPLVELQTSYQPEFVDTHQQKLENGCFGSRRWELRTSPIMAEFASKVTLAHIATSSLAEDFE